jgi:hypothetical protein
VHSFKEKETNIDKVPPNNLKDELGIQELKDGNGT